MRPSRVCSKAEAELSIDLVVMSTHGPDREEAHAPRQRHRAGGAPINLSGRSPPGQRERSGSGIRRAGNPQSPSNGKPSARQPRRARRRPAWTICSTGCDRSPAGLTAAEAARRLKEAGPNDPAATKQGGPLAEFLRFCASPLVIILFVASVTAALLGQVVDASIIAVMVLLSVILNFMQAYRSEREVERLRERVAPTATVLRDAAWSEIPRRDLVPGDILRLCAGDLVPADARLIQSRDLHVQEAALTGESTPAEKSAAEQKSEEPSALAANMVFLGTSVVSGTATALVVATGKATAFGDIVLRLALRRPETEFDRGIRQFGILILETVTFLVLFIMLVNIAMHRDALESLLFAVALAVGLTPEFLPMITTVTLGQRRRADGPRRR